VSRKRYAKEFKVEAARLVIEQGLTQAKAAANLGVSTAIIGRWVRQFKEGGLESFPGSGKLPPSEEKVKNLEKELKRVTLERDILKKAIAYFAEVPK
jgi:transposase